MAEADPPFLSLAEIAAAIQSELDLTPTELVAALARHHPVDEIALALRSPKGLALPLPALRVALRDGLKISEAEATNALLHCI